MNGRMMIRHYQIYVDDCCAAQARKRRRSRERKAARVIVPTTVAEISPASHASEEDIAAYRQTRAFSSGK